MGTGFTEFTLLPRLDDFAVTCPVVPSVSRRMASPCSSPRRCVRGRYGRLRQAAACPLPVSGLLPREQDTQRP